MASEPSDAELVRAYLSGSPAAFTTLVRRHERRTYNLAYRMLAREEDAKDATQEAFVSALRKLSSYRGDAAFTTWLHRVTVNVCYDALRKRRREDVVDQPEPAEGSGPSAPDHADASAVSVDVQRALARVPEEFRAALVLHDVQDLGYEEVAEILGIPVGTVKSRLHRGRVALGRALSGEHAGVRPPSEGSTQG